MKPIYLIAMVCLPLLFSCSSKHFQSQESRKNEFLAEFERLVLIVENRGSISEAEWSTEFEPKYKKLSEVDFREFEKILTESEFGLISDYKNRYRNKRITSKAANSVKETFRNAKNFLNGNVLKNSW